ncbi:hypothetical protein MOX02_30270 [Methylobacterium oxalidis]|uniref:Uncharacterized protein n=1 Tax=Methylobacterium oxalidis TaxID=944322 RepID=A0A512J539_9HYPH|nr:hypothetical protein MOX02_30270 [Methylobacterium oxalidis]GLS63727.1 hypothetical protein GCM10007888_21080 [Methylobacterium oxalidis]
MRLAAAPELVAELRRELQPGRSPADHHDAVQANLVLARYHALSRPLSARPGPAAPPSSPCRLWHRFQNNSNRVPRFIAQAGAPGWRSGWARAKASSARQVSAIRRTVG